LALSALIVPLFEQLLFALYSVARITQQSDGYTAGKSLEIFAQTYLSTWQALIGQRYFISKIQIRESFFVFCIRPAAHRFQNSDHA
jgi:hypothetical protein